MAAPRKIQASRNTLSSRRRSRAYSSPQKSPGGTALPLALRAPDRSPAGSSVPPPSAANALSHADTRGSSVDAPAQSDPSAPSCSGPAEGEVASSGEVVSPHPWPSPRALRLPCPARRPPPRYPSSPAPPAAERLLSDGKGSTASAASAGATSGSGLPPRRRGGSHRGADRASSGAGLGRIPGRRLPSRTRRASSFSERAWSWTNAAICWRKALSHQEGDGCRGGRLGHSAGRPGRSRRPAPGLLDDRLGLPLRRRRRARGPAGVLQLLPQPLVLLVHLRQRLGHLVEELVDVPLVVSAEGQTEDLLLHVGGVRRSAPAPRAAAPRRSRSPFPARGSSFSVPCQAS